MTSNHPIHSLVARAIVLETQRRESAEDLKELYFTAMKNGDCDELDIAVAKKRVKAHFETDKAKEKRVAVEERQMTLFGE